MFFPTNLIYLCFLESWEFAQFTTITCYALSDCVCTSRSCNTTNASCNPWTASKSDRATKIIFNFAFQWRILNFEFFFYFFIFFFLKLMKSSLENNTIYVSYYVTFIPQKNSRRGGPILRVWVCTTESIHRTSGCVMWGVQGWHEGVKRSCICANERWQVEQKPGGRGRGREWATLGVHPLSWLLSNNRLEKVPFVSVPHTSSYLLLLSNQDKGCTPSVAHSLPLPLGPALLNLWSVLVHVATWSHGLWLRQLRRYVSTIKLSLSYGIDFFQNKQPSTLNMNSPDGQ